MLDDSARFDTNTTKIAASVMDGEVVLIDLSTGVYYSTDNVGGLVWEAIDLGFSVSEIVSAVADRYHVAAERVHDDVHQLVEELLREEVVISSGADIVRGELSPPSDDADSSYANPVLNVYRDMGDLLALDAPMPDMDDIPLEDKSGE